MKDGVYINLKNDKANLFVVENGKIEDGDAISVFDYDFGDIQLVSEPLMLKMTLNNIQYLGELE